MRIGNSLAAGFKTVTARFTNVAVVFMTMVVASATASADDTARTAETIERTPPRSVTLQHRAARGAPVWGPRFAPVTADYYLDLRRTFHNKNPYRALIKLQRAHPRRLRIVVRLIDRPSSGAYIAEAALEAHRQGRFFEFLNALFERRRQPARKELPAICKRAAVDCKRVTDAIDGRHHTATLELNRRHMARMGVSHTSGTVVFNGVETTISITSPRGFSRDTLERRYDLAYEDALELLRHGATAATVYRHALRRRHRNRPVAPVPWGSIDGVPRRPKGVSFRSSQLAGRATGRLERHIRGAERPRVVISFFCSFQSMNCGATWSAIRKVLEAFPDDVQLHFNHAFDSQDANQPDAQRAHEAALCAEDQGAFWEFYDYHFGTVSNRPSRHLDTKLLGHTARSLGVDGKRFLRCWESGTHALTARRLATSSRAAGIRHTPTVILNGRLYEGRFTHKTLLRLVAEELRPGLLERHFPLRLDSPEESR